LRTLEREAQEGDDAARGAYLRARVRAGLPPWVVRLLAMLGDPGARAGAETGDGLSDEFHSNPHRPRVSHETLSISINREAARVDAPPSREAEEARRGEPYVTRSGAWLAAQMSVGRACSPELADIVEVALRVKLAAGWAALPRQAMADQALLEVFVGPLGTPPQEPRLHLRAVANWLRKPGPAPDSWALGYGRAWSTGAQAIAQDYACGARASPVMLDLVSEVQLAGEAAVLDTVQAHITWWLAQRFELPPSVLSWPRDDPWLHAWLLTPDRPSIDPLSLFLVDEEPPFVPLFPPLRAWRP
jgi:hypothetical protein